MTSLLIDTACEHGLMALCCGSKVASELVVKMGLLSSESPLCALDALMKASEISVNQLQYVAVGVGPGSYTGIRIGVSYAKALSFACNIPLVGVCGLYGYIPEEGFSGSFLSVIDAKIGGVYLIQGQMEGGKIQFLTPPSLVAFEQFVELLEKTDCVVTPASAALKVRLKGYEHAHMPMMKERSPDALRLHMMAEEQFRKGDYSLDGTLQLLYLRKTQAEIDKR